MNIGINGFGRIGRLVLRCFSHEDESRAADRAQGDLKVMFVSVRPCAERKAARSQT